MLKEIKQRFHDQCIQNQSSKIYYSPKLTFFHSVYTMGSRPHYVDSLVNKCDRSAISKIRVSAHPLMIERGRHLNMQRNNRYCPICNNGEIEDEKHFLLACSGYIPQRQIFINKISNIINPLEYESIHNKIKYLMNNSSPLILRIYSSFISDCLKLRKTLI